MFLYCFIRLSYCKITLKIKKQKYNFSKHNHLGIFAQKKIYVEKHRTRGFAQKKSAGVCESCWKISFYSAMRILIVNYNDPLFSCEITLIKLTIQK